MLRPVRRTRRALAAALATVTALALIWPAAIVSGRAPSSTSSAATTAAPAPHAEREPSLHGLGIKPLKANGEKRTKPLKHVAVDHANRGNGAGSERSLEAPDIQATPPASVQVTGSGAPAADSFGFWAGIDQATSTFEPPDPWVAVGPDDVVQTVNTRIRFTNREGKSTAPDVEVFDFFAFDELVPGDADYISGVGDPRFVYDAKHNRWLGITLAWHCDTDGAGAADDSLGYVWGAISSTGDPTGDYYQFYVLYNSFLPDFPALGTSGDKFSITANEYVLTDDADCTSAAPYDGGSIMTFDWSQMLTFPALPDGTYEFDNGWFALRPALSPQATSNTIFIVGEKLLAAPAGNTTSNVAYMTVTGTNAGGGTTLSAERDLTSLGVVPPFVDPPAPRQPGGALAPGIVDRRPTDAILQGNLLTFVTTSPCDPAGGSVETRDCARVTQLTVSTSATPTRKQDMLIASSGKDIWYPGAGMSQSGILHVVYSVSSPSEGMSSFDRYQLPGGAAHKLSAAREIANGHAFQYQGDRWGDFVGVAQDPRDVNAVWQGNQYTNSAGAWATRVSELQTAGATYVPITPVRMLDSRPGSGNTGLSGVFQANVPRTVDIAGRGGVPDNAVAITGNLTIVSQTQAGYAAVTPTPNANPPTASLNFPLGDNRGNNLTSPLGAAGGVSIVYKASPGRTAHFVLDVTGYYINAPSGATFKTIGPVRILDTRPGSGHVGIAGPVPSNVNKQIQVWGVKGIPTSAIAVVGNLAVTGQTAGGYISLSTTPPPPLPKTSNLNFPLGDTRANGLTIKLTATGTFWAVYKAPPGKTAHMVFDVSGYYVQDLTGARFVPLTPGRRMDTRFPAPNEGTTGRFVAKVPRGLVVEPYQGVPANATAVTGNLTVVSPTRAGFVSMTPTADSTPPNATINFPIGDIRGNGVTGPLSSAGNVAFVFMASGGQTHLVFDLTGYFR